MLSPSGSTRIGQDGGDGEGGPGGTCRPATVSPQGLRVVQPAFRKQVGVPFSLGPEYQEKAEQPERDAQSLQQSAGLLLGWLERSIPRQSWPCTSVQLAPVELSRGEIPLSRGGCTPDSRDAAATVTDVDSTTYHHIINTYAPPHGMRAKRDWQPDWQPSVSRLAARLAQQPDTDPRRSAQQPARLRRRRPRRVGDNETTCMAYRMYLVHGLVHGSWHRRRARDSSCLACPPRAAGGLRRQIARWRGSRGLSLTS